MQDPPKFKSNIDWRSQPLGKVPDKELAAQLMVNVRTVGKQRRKRRIAPYYPATKAKRINWDNEPLGKQSDLDISERLGCAKSSVSRARWRRKIPAKYDNVNTFRFHLTREETLLLYQVLKTILLGKSIEVLTRQKEFPRILSEVQRVYKRIEGRTR